MNKAFFIFFCHIWWFLKVEHTPKELWTFEIHQIYHGTNIKKSLVQFSSQTPIFRLIPSTRKKFLFRVITRSATIYYPGGFYFWHHSTYLNSFWREVTRLLLELFAKAKSLFSANRFAFPIDEEGCCIWPWAALVGSNMANFAFTKPLWSKGSLEGRLVSSKTCNLDLWQKIFFREINFLFVN